MNCVGVTCLTVVSPSGYLKSCPSYLAEISFQVPTNLLSDLMSPFESAGQTVVVVTASATITRRHRIPAATPVTTVLLAAFLVGICFVLSSLCLGLVQTLLLRRINVHSIWRI